MKPWELTKKFEMLVAETCGIKVCWEREHPHDLSWPELKTITSRVGTVLGNAGLEAVRAEDAAPRVHAKAGEGANS